MEDHIEQKCIEVVGKKIELHHRRGDVTSSTLNAEVINSECGIFDEKDCDDAQLDFRRASLIYDDNNRLEFNKNDNSEAEEEISLG